MVFSSLMFIFLFLPAVLVIYFAVPGYKAKNVVILISSLIFYAWGEPVYIFLIMISTVLDYTWGRLIGKYRETDKKRCRLFVACSVTINLLILGFFKYAGFLVGTLNSVTGLALSVPHLALPIGISFYTFQTMSYTIDVYRGDAPVQKKFLNFALYVTMFPQLIAGPIVRYCDIQSQLENHGFNSVDFSNGVRRFMTGLFKKVLIANNIAMFWDKVQAAPELSVLSAWLGIIAYTFQIYFDFSGYSDMAIGLGHMFGFTITENFNYPYISKSISEFWRRWHMTLGTWFKEYLYIPLGGNRKGKLKLVRNLAIVWLLTGLWHGASWNFVLWGGFYGLLIICEKLFLNKFLDRCPNILRHIYTMFCVIFGWAFFAPNTFAESGRLISAMFGAAPFADNLGIYGLRTYWLIFAIAFFCSMPIVKKLFTKLQNKGKAGKTIWVLLYAAGFFISIASLVDATYNPFLYFRF